ncbi:hypothetical protein AB0M22_44470 [Nocardia sp. NPDC051756]|uniref:hypothetical protein n=1 Tax=Nocardia sp. NPDC051756 TaxID=3154751 RepID=UPI003412E048
MTRPDRSSPPTYAEALRIARERERDSGTLAYYAHQGLENARYGRGFAFSHTVGTDRGPMDGYVLVTAAGYAGGVLWAEGQTIDTVIAEHLARAEHANRDIPDSELSAAHRLALAAYDAGHTRISEMPGPAIDAETADYAEFVLLNLRRGRNQEGTGRNILARNDFLLQAPAPGRRYTQACPHCASPTIYTERYPRAVCDDCLSRTTDRAGRQITGYNTSFSGGMIAYTDTIDRSDSPGEECVEVTRTGMCFIDGHPATMQEARFGGIVVQISSAD